MATTTKPAIQLVVTDLDNTLYDWVTFFVTSFYEMVDVAARLLGTSKEDLLDELQAVHRHYHDSEYPYALLETEIARNRYPGADRRERKQELAAAFDAFNLARERTLTLYPTVRETLAFIHQAGTKIVGHTEASVPNALFRLRKLGCLDLMARLYAVEHTGEDHPIPEKSVRFDPALDRVRFLRQEQRKPNPAVLMTICRDHSVQPENVLYIGDSISRDIGMAVEARTRSAFAEYGVRYDKNLWTKLVRITHWSNEDVVRAEEARRLYGNCQADVTLSRAFEEVLDHFSFQPTP